MSWRPQVRSGFRDRSAGPARWAAFGFLVVLVTAGLHTPVAGAAVNGVTFTAAMNGQPAASSSDAHPAQLYSNALAKLHLTVTNHGGSAVHISTVRFEGDVLDLPLFSFDTGVNLVVPPHRTESLSFPVVLTGVGSQATGLIVASITLISENGAGLASQSLVTNVHGSLSSIYGLFGLAVLILTVLSLVLGLLGMARHTLPQNRWMRAVRFLIPGFGVGLVLTFTMSAFHVFTPGPGHWLPLLIVPSAVGLALGFLTPAPVEEEFDDYDDDVLLAQIVVVDDDPLEGGDGKSGTDAVRPSRGVPDSRPTGATDAVRPSRGVPDSRPTGGTDVVTSPAPGVPDSRPTAP
jgi:hypothetical protein